MNWKVGLLSVVIFFAICSLGRGAEEAAKADHKWEQYSKDNRGVLFFYDKEALDLGTRGIIKVWRKREFPVRSGQKAIISLDEIDCFKQKYRSLELQVVGWDDSAETFKRVAEWSTIYGDSPEEYFLDNTCKETRKKSKK